VIVRNINVIPPFYPACGDLSPPIPRAKLVLASAGTFFFHPNCLDILRINEGMLLVPDEELFTTF
ncbi:uncharacterized protein METZ01_LOCUS319482, partial [marine metagenome]